jgi:universal stress protein E
MALQAWKSILVAVREPGARKQVALRKAAAIASRTGASLTLFHAFAAPPLLPGSPSVEARTILQRVASQLRRQLLDLAKPLRARGIDVRCDTVWDFPPAHAIVRRALAGKPDLVVAESHHHTRLARWFLANSDWELIRECPCPVWFVKQERLPAEPLVVTAVDPAHVRASESSLDDRLLTTSNALTQQLGGRIALLHVEDMTSFGSKRQRQTAATWTRDALERLAHRHGLEDAARELRSGRPAPEIVAAANALEADVLVMGVLSRSGLDPHHIGRNAEHVLDHVACDVIVVKPRGFQTEVRRKGPALPRVRR